MTVVVRLLVVLAFVSGCTTALKKIEKATVQSPEIKDLAQIEYYPGQWEMEKCLYTGKQAERVDIGLRDGKIVLQRWQKKADQMPSFTAIIKPGQQTEIDYQSKDMISDNPVMTKAQWTWMDQRLVTSMLWRPGQGDQRGNWSAVATGQFYIKKGEPHKMRWARWGSSHSSRHGQQTWQSECIYKRMSKLALVKKSEGIEVKLPAIAESTYSSESHEKVLEFRDDEQSATAFNHRHDNMLDSKIMDRADQSASQMHDRFQRNSVPRPRRSIEMDL